MVRIEELHQGQVVLAAHERIEDSEAIGELIAAFTIDDAEYLHVRRYGAGLDDLYIPALAVRQVVENHVYLDLNAADLVAQPWHEYPGQDAT